MTIRRYMLIIILCYVPGRGMANLPTTPYDVIYAQLTDLYKKYNIAKDREQSSTNKLLGALSIGATGIGGMQLMAGMAEQTADDDAERDMRAYLATFSCSYGTDHIKYGQTDIELPAGNNLTTLVTEYKQLAADLKQRKEALGHTPGIESEIALDSAKTGLYNNAAIGKTSGAYTSVSRALSSPDSNDATAWTEQKSSAGNKTKSGTIIGGIGAVGGVIGNIIESAAHNKNNK